MRILLIDNFDSFTNNIAQALLRVQCSQVVIKRNNELTYPFTKDDTFDAIVISPGPGNPALASDLGVCADILKHDERPIFGVCLGHQAIAHFEGGKVVLAPEPVHGQRWLVEHNQKGLLRGLPHPFHAVRYHSWMVDSALPEDLVCDATTPEGIVMAIRHLKKPRWGVQFHPESIDTDAGERLFANFLDAVRDTTSVVVSPGRNKTRRGPVRNFHWRRIGNALDPADVFARLQNQSGDGAILESADTGEGRGRFSYVAVPDTPLDRIVSYDLSENRLQISPPNDRAEYSNESIFDYLNKLLGTVNVIGENPPFAFRGGAIGWMGYELKAESGGQSVWRSPTPDATFAVVHRFVVVDHLEDELFACAVVTEGQNSLAEEWIADLESIMGRPNPNTVVNIDASKKSTTPVRFTPRHGPEKYRELIENCQDLIRRGESYELCLTNQINADVTLDPWSLYQVLRRRNPAPYGAYLSFGDVSVVGSSPERFLKVFPDGLVEAKPIKGTIRRGDTAAEDRTLRHALANSKKDRAENLMIVDLLRHDLAAIAVPGCVSVPKLADIESYTNVHQMVSTVRAYARPDVSTIDIIRGCFPGGSMTGAPKIRSMALLDTLESGPRGIYSGAIGWIGFDGQSDLSIVIRTIVASRDSVSIGCGGAITILSDSESELEEMLLKAELSMSAVAETVTGDPNLFELTTDDANLTSAVETDTTRSYLSARGDSKRQTTAKVSHAKTEYQSL